MQLLTLLLTVLYSLVVFASNGIVVVLAIVHRHTVRKHWKAGLLVGVVIALLALPTQVLTLVYLDIEAAVPPDATLPPGMLESIVLGAKIGAGVGAVLGAVMGLALCALQLPVADAADPERPAFPLLTRSPGALAGWVPAVAVGAVAGVVSIGVFHALGVQEGQAVRDMVALFPGLDFNSPVVIVGMLLPAVLSAAISEEIVFRGILQRWLTRWLGGGMGAVVASIGLVSMVWAVGHAVNTDHLGLKLLQILLLGFAFGALARKYSVEASIVAHLSLNAVAVLGALALAQLTG